MTRHILVWFLVGALGSLGCSRSGQPENRPADHAADQRVQAFADAYLKGYLDRYPEEATAYGVPGRHDDRLSDNSLEAVKAWEVREDA